MKLIIDIDEKTYIKAQAGILGSFGEIIANGTSLLTTLNQIREEIKGTYYSQGAGFDDFSHGFIYSKNEDMKIIDKYI